jgi:hypothetical protein
MNYESPDHNNGWEQYCQENNIRKELLPWKDTDAIKKYPDIEWVYDKYLMSEKVGTKAWDLNTETPREFPIIVKPRMNLLGGGVDAHRANNLSEIRTKNNMVAQPYFAGRHLTTDFIIYQGVVVDWYSFACHKDKNDSFVLFSSIDEYDKAAVNAVQNLPLENGIVNVETIDNNIIEMHLRPSAQFYDISGKFLQKYLKQYERRLHAGDYEHSEFEKTYSKVIRVKKDGVPEFKGKLELPIGVRSVLFSWIPGQPLSAIKSQDPHSYRLLVINGTNLAIIDKFAKELQQEIIIT